MTSSQLEAILDPKVDEQKAEEEVSRLQGVLDDQDFSFKPDIDMSDVRKGLGRFIGNQLGRMLPGRAGRAAGTVLGDVVGGTMSRSGGGAGGGTEDVPDSAGGMGDEAIAIAQLRKLDDILEELEALRGESVGGGGGGGLGDTLLKGAGLSSVLGLGTSAIPGAGAASALGGAAKGLSMPKGMPSVGGMMPSGMGFPALSNFFPKTAGKVEEMMPGFDNPFDKVNEQGEGGSTLAMAGMGSSGTLASMLGLGGEGSPFQQGGITVEEPEWLSELEIDQPQWLSDLKLQKPQWLSMLPGVNDTKGDEQVEQVDPVSESMQESEKNRFEHREETKGNGDGGGGSETVVNFNPTIQAEQERERLVQTVLSEVNEKLVQDIEDIMNGRTPARGRGMNR